LLVASSRLLHLSDTDHQKEPSISPRGNKISGESFRSQYRIHFPGYAVAKCCASRPHRFFPPWSTVTELLLLMEAMTGNVSKSGS